jgi:hypothetical protein
VLTNIIFGQRVKREKPDISLIVPAHAAGIVKAPERLLDCIVDLSDDTRTSIHEAEPPKRGLGPNISGIILQQFAGSIRAKTVRIERSVMIGSKCISVIALQTVVGRDPDIALIVLNDGIYMIAGQPIGSSDTSVNVIGTLRVSLSKGKEQERYPHIPACHIKEIT